MNNLKKALYYIIGIGIIVTILLILSASKWTEIHIHHY